jgi:hypothetical protein
MPPTETLPLRLTGSVLLLFLAIGSTMPGCASNDGTSLQALTVKRVIPSGNQCRWPTNDQSMVEGLMDLISLEAPGGGIGHSRRYIVGVTWKPTHQSDIIDENFIVMKSAEVRIDFAEASPTPATQATRSNLPAVYSVPTSGTQVDEDPIAVFDLIPTWVARRLAQDANIWQATSANNSAGGALGPGKSYLLPVEFRLIGENLGGLKVHSNWFRWVINLCRGCNVKFESAPAASAKFGFPGNLETLGTPPKPEGLVRWCAGGVSQGEWEFTKVAPSIDLQPRQYP